MSEPAHIVKGLKLATAMTESDAREVLLKKIQYVKDRNKTFESFNNDMAHWGGTLPDFTGQMDTGGASRSWVSVELRDGRKFKFSKRELWDNKPIQATLF